MDTLARRQACSSRSQRSTALALGPAPSITTPNLLATIAGGKWRSRLQQDSAGSEARGRAMHAGRSNARRRGNDRCAWAEVDRHAWKPAREETTRGRRIQAEGSARDACASVWTSRRNKPMNEKVKAWEMETCNHLHAACNPSQ
jgi:hypothetical protein